MDTQKYKIARLLAAYFCDGITEKEREKLMEWINASKENHDFFETICSNNRSQEKFAIYQSTDWKKALENFERTHYPSRRISRKKFLWYAASIAVISSFSLLLSRPQYSSRNISTQTAQVEIMSLATLTLSNGQSIVLTSRDSAFTLNSIDVNIHAKNQQLIYKKEGEFSHKSNILKTPRGGEYKVILSDGTFVYLNAATELKYPVVFDSLKREVYLCGEAWFEVQKDSQKPFYVITDHAKIRVYGTKFNVNTFPEEGMETVLLEGAVGVQGVKSLKECLLKPSQLARVSKETGQIEIKNVDPLLYIGWKDGLLVFSNERLDNIMNKLATWYNVDIFYTNNNLKDIRFSGYLKKYDKIEIILKAIEESVGVDCGLKNRTITISQ
ncbi:FecR family protein [Butyricimonas faecihominis]|jgi:transmembrane sensor